MTIDQKLDASLNTLERQIAQSGARDRLFLDQQATARRAYETYDAAYRLLAHQYERGELSGRVFDAEIAVLRQQRDAAC